MQIIRTSLWALLLIALLLFSINNWTAVDVIIWDGLVLETKLPALVLVSFLLGLAPMWVFHMARRWRMNRRISALENSVRAVAPPPPMASASKPEPSFTDSAAH